MIADLRNATKDELLEEARARAIEGRSEMDKDELIAALRDSYRENPPPEPRIG